MKLSLLLDSQAPAAAELASDVQSRLAAADDILGDVELELVLVEGADFAAQRAALSEVTGERIAWLAAGASAEDLLKILRARAATRDNEVTAALQEPKLSGGARMRRLAHRVLCRLGGRRSPPNPQGTSWVFDRIWLPAVLQVPADADVDVPLLLAALHVRWEREWGTLQGGSPLPLGAALKRGWQRLLLIGGALELGLLIALGFYGLSGILAMLGSQSSWALKGILGLVLGAITSLTFGVLQLLARRKLRSALRVAADVRDALIMPPGWSSN
ncbi:MAG: hypothetical protein H6718_12730 [Polyangiaceae bacterium]|nr:hypothetical protein [Myxococcales bacterium]MCB9586260.1 hypothetical protein [Polyangiaceae bacterium]MCB9606937.1 hypothetical protein [Polyangiaceae bacterium]